MGQNTGDSATALTEHSAAQAIEALLSREEEPQPAETPTPEPEVTTPPAEASNDEEVETALSPEEESEEVDGEPVEKPEQPTKHKVKVQDQELEVTLDEALKGYSRTEDYTRKTQKLSEEKKAFEAEQNAVRAERQHNAAKLTELDTALTSLVQEPDWDKLQRENPDQFASVHAAWQIHQKRLETIRGERAKVERQLQADAETQFNQHVAAERAKLADAIPEWKDAEISKKDMAALVDYATGNGFSNEELNQVTDHRAIILLRKAMLYDQSQKAKATATTTAQGKIEKVKVASPGPAATTRPKSTELAKRMQRLKNSGRQSDAASAIELMLSDG